MNNDEFLANLYMLSDKNETDAAIGLVFEYFDEACLNGEFARIDQCLRMVGIANLNTSVKVALLVAANWAQRELPYYSALYHKMVDSVEDTNKEGLFMGLAPTWADVKKVLEKAGV